MQRKREHNKEEQTHFAKKHSILDGVYMTDFDGFTSTLSNTENELYAEWTYNNSSGGLVINRFIETKSRKSGYIKSVLEGEREPSQQLVAFVTMATELNAYRKDKNQPTVSCYLVIEDFGEYPYEVYEMENNKGKIEFTFIGKVFDDAEYKQMFQI